MFLPPQRHPQKGVKEKRGVGGGRKNIRGRDCPARFPFSAALAGAGGSASARRLAPLPIGGAGGRTDLTDGATGEAATEWAAKRRRGRPVPSPPARMPHAEAASEEERQRRRGRPGPRHTRRPRPNRRKKAAVRKAGESRVPRRPLPSRPQKGAARQAGPSPHALSRDTLLIRLFPGLQSRKYRKTPCMIRKRLSFTRPQNTKKPAFSAGFERVVVGDGFEPSNS